MPLIAAGVDFLDEPVAVFGALLMAGALLVSIIAHGLTDHPGAEWMARRAEREPERAVA